MKRRTLLVAFSLLALASQAQVTLTGTSYTQNFDGLGSGLPVGWNVYTGATNTTLGTNQALKGGGVPAMPFQIGIDTSCASLIVSGGFKNYPSAAVISPSVNFCPGTSGTSTVSATYSNRSLGVRQTGSASFPNADPGAAFALNIANTKNISNIKLSFKLQSLDTSSSRTTTWTVDYGIGASPTNFIPATTTGILTTGNHIFANDSISATFGTALDNQNSPVWIRIVALSGTTGSGNRATTAIDDFTLTYANTTGIDDLATEAALALNVIGAPTSDKVMFAYNTQEEGKYNLSIYDLAGRVLHTQTVDTKAGYSQLTVQGLSLPGGMYIAKMSNSNSSSAAKIMIQ